MDAPGKRRPSAGLFLRLLIFISMTMFPTTFGSVDTSLVLLATTQTVQDYYTGIVFMYGNPDNYLPELIRNSTSNTSYRKNIIYYAAPSQNNIPVDADYRQGALYWSNEYSIFYQDLETLVVYPWILRDSSNTTANTYFGVPVSTQLTGFSLDWVYNLLYWSDAGYQRIGVIDTASFTYWRIVVDTNLSSPQDVVAYPPQSYLFWSDAGSTPKIEMLDLTQNNRKILVTSPTVQSPKTLVIDYASLRLYWLDTAKAEVSSVNFDGSDYTPWQLRLFAQISSFLLYKQYFVFADQSNFVLYVFNASQNVYNFTDNSLQGISDVVMYEPTRQPYVTSPCTVNNGGCQEFCITINATSRQCQCTFGWFLAADGTSCVTHPLEDNFIFVTDKYQQRIYQVDTATGELRGVVVSGYVSESPMAYDNYSNVLYVLNQDAIIAQIDLTTYNTTIYASGLRDGYTFNSINSIAYDPLGRTLYYVAANQYSNYSIRQIQKPQPNQTLITIFYTETGAQPNAIVLDVSSRSMYWFDCEKMSIEKANLSDPMNHKSVLSSLSGCASTMVIDFQSGDIYWVNYFTTIQTVKLNGSQQSELYRANFSINGLAVDNSYVYISSRNLRYLIKISRSSGQSYNLTQNLFTLPYALLGYSGITDLTKTTNTVTTNRVTTTPTVSSRGGMTDGKWTMTVFFTVLAFLQIRAAKNNTRLSINVDVFTQ